jgi:ABC-2 type transport system ATP-binding protein
MKRRVNLAAGLLHKPRILFLDEPTVGVDPQSRNHIFENVERLNREGLTILYTTHYMEEAERLCHRVAIIDQGKIVALDTPKALIESLGGGMIHIGFADSQMDAVLEQSRALRSVQAVRRTDGKLEVATASAQRALLDLLEIANRLDARVTALQVFEPNLETVFLHLTGKRLRD